LKRPPSKHRRKKLKTSEEGNGNEENSNDKYLEQLFNDLPDSSRLLYQSQDEESIPTNRSAANTRKEPESSELLKADDSLVVSSSSLSYLPVIHPFHLPIPYSHVPLTLFPVVNHMNTLPQTPSPPEYQEISKIIHQSSSTYSPWHSYSFGNPVEPSNPFQPYDIPMFSNPVSSSCPFPHKTTRPSELNNNSGEKKEK
jgi:hypothetical protein